ncbi:MAG: hypothetical protein KKA19_06460 [Candidatus Margulisbacteria bacterium]|nr:hypothetical protein [Candidatus Margulisiibacteriota bacterium]
MKKIIAFILLNIFTSTCYAGLLDSQDQVLNGNLGLAGNAAATAYNKRAYFAGGVTVFDNFTQNKDVLDNENIVVGYNGNDLVPKMPWPNAFFQFAQEIPGAGWLNISYDKNYQTGSSYRLKRQGPLDSQKIDVFTSSGRETMRATYSLDYNHQVPGLHLGGEFGINKDTNIFNLSQNNASHAARGGLTGQNLEEVSNYYFSYGLGGIYEADRKNLFTLSHLIYNHKLVEEKGKDINNNIVDIEYNEVMPAETIMGYMYKLTNNLELGGTLKIVWPVTYTQIGNRWTTATSGPESDIDVYKRGYKVYTLAGEYDLPDELAFQPWLKGIAFQGYYGWSDPYAEQINTNQPEIDVAGHETTEMGINAIQLIREYKIIFGINRIRQLTATTGEEIDNTKFYINYSTDFEFI